MKKRTKGLIHPVDAYVGGRLRSARQEKGLSQEKVAFEVGVTFQQIQKYEKGSNRISCSKLYEFATLFGTDVASFFQGFELPESCSISQLQSMDGLAASQMISNRATKTGYRSRLDSIDEAIKSTIAKEAHFVQGAEGSRYATLGESTKAQSIGDGSRSLKGADDELAVDVSTEEMSKIMKNVQGKDLLYIVDFLTKGTTASVRKTVLQVLAVLNKLT